MKNQIRNIEEKQRLNGTCFFTGVLYFNNKRMNLMYYPTNDEFVIIEWHKISREDSQKVREVVKSKFYHGMIEKKIAV